MGSAKVVSLAVLPVQSSHLCFETDGILGQATAQLGDAVTAFDFAAFYAILGAMPTVSGDASRLLYDFLEIQGQANPFTLAALRAEPAKAALNKAVNARQNAYFAKYGNAAAVINQINDFYSPSVVGSKPQRLAVLSAIADLQASELQTAYTSDGRLGVIKTTSSLLTSVTESYGSSSETGQTNEETVGFVASGTYPNPPKGGTPFYGWTFPAPDAVSLDEGTSGSTTTSSGTADERQAIVNTDYGYRVPYLESQAQNERAQISLIDQQFSQFMYAQNLPDLATVFQNELNSIDADVYGLQIAYLNTILMSPIAGTVTGVYKHPGDAVRAGEPVIRVENSSDILLVARLVYPARISIGSTLTVQTPIFEAPGPLTTITGNVVAIRGQRDDNQWEVIASCDNLDMASKPIFPLGYHFDYDDTTVTVS